MMKTTFLAIALSLRIILVPQMATIHRIMNPDLRLIRRESQAVEIVKESEVAEECQEEYETQEQYTYYQRIEPTYEELKPVLVNCEDWELEELARLAYLEAGADWMSDDCIRAVIEVVFNQLNYGHWGNTLHDVIFSVNPDGTRNYSPAMDIPYTEPSERCRQLVYQVYEEGIRIPSRVMFFRAYYYHQWQGAIPEFEIDGVYFSSSYWCQ